MLIELELMTSTSLYRVYSKLGPAKGHRICPSLK